MTDPATFNGRHPICTLHGILCCAVCCKHEGQCDYGHCQERATEVIRTKGLTEQRPMCARHRDVAVRCHGDAYVRSIL